MKRTYLLFLLISSEVLAGHIVLNLDENEIFQFKNTTHFNAHLKLPKDKIELSKPFINEQGSGPSVGETSNQPYLSALDPNEVGPSAELEIKLNGEKLDVPEKVLRELKNYLFTGPRPVFRFWDESLEEFSFTCVQFGYQVGIARKYFDDQCLGYTQVGHSTYQITDSGRPYYNTGSIILFKSANSLLHSAIVLKGHREEDMILLSKYGKGPILFSKFSELKKLYPAISHNVLSNLEIYPWQKH